LRFQLDLPVPFFYIAHIKMKLQFFILQNIFIVLVLFSAMGVLISGCSGSKGTISENETMTGTIKVVGNEPFTRLALQTAEGKTYILECQKETRALLLQHQGYQATVEYDSVRQSFEGTTLRVTQAQIRQTAKD
jgi:hypothetical protein